MANSANIASVHRFRDELALTACDHDEGATVYLSLKQAKAMRAAMGRVIRSIERHEFVDAPRGLSFSVKVRDRRYTHGAIVARDQA